MQMTFTVFLATILKENVLSTSKFTRYMVLGSEIKFNTDQQ